MLLLGDVFKKINFLVFFNKSTLINNYSAMSWLLEDIFEKKLNITTIIPTLLELIKPPFIVKTLSIPKKLKKKSKLKYKIKFIYKNDLGRIKESFKQLYYGSNNYMDCKLKTRIYKTLLLTMLEWKNSKIFKYKLMVFKKFFKI